MSEFTYVGKHISCQGTVLKLLLFLHNTFMKCISPDSPGGGGTVIQCESGVSVSILSLCNVRQLNSIHSL